MNPAPETDPPTLQDIVDELAGVLRRPVIVRNAARSLQVASDPQRTDKPLLRALEADDVPGAHNADVEVPVSGRTGLLGHVLVLSDGGRPMQGADLDALDAGVALVRDVLDGPAGHSGHGRDDVARELLGSDAVARRSAFATALERRWLQRGEGTRVRAVVVDPGVSNVVLVAFGRSLSGLRPVPLLFAGTRAGVLFLVSLPSSDALDEKIMTEGAARGIRILGIGSASPARSADDLKDAADEAVRAAELSTVFEEFRPAVDVTALGGWLLLASSTSEPSRLGAISPAAHRLHIDGDDAQRRTVEAYLDAGTNVVVACQSLFIHRTTLYYRLERMPEVVRDALADGMKRSTLHLALKLLRLWEATGRL